MTDLDALVDRAEAYARPEPAMPKSTGNYEIVRGLLAALAAERDRADRAEAALSRLSDAHDVHVEMDKTFEHECPQCRHEATA